MWENAYLSIKNPKASRALKQALDPGHRLLASLVQLCFTTSATFDLRSWGPPLDQILDPHLLLLNQGDLIYSIFFMMANFPKISFLFFIVSHSHLIKFI